MKTVQSKKPNTDLDRLPAIVKKTLKFAMRHLRMGRCQHLPFHNVQHTKEVFLNTRLIGHHEHLSRNDLEIVLLAALLHDLGNANCFDGHEQVSKKIAKEFLSGHGYAQNETNRVVSCIQATQMPQTPKNTLEKVLCDADLFHLGTTDFIKKNRALRKEWKTHKKMEFSDAAWYGLNIAFLEQHRYFTRYGKEVLAKGKKKNIQLLKNKQKTTHEQA